MSRYSDLPFVQAGGHGGNRSMTQCVVIHATDNTAPASGEANYAQTRSDGTSAHFYSDETQVIQALDTVLVAYGCYPTGNSRSVQFELVGRSNQLTDATLRRVAPVVARACAEWGIPIRHVGPADLRAGTKGICGHGDVTAAWGEGDHTDPGNSFPWGTFISYVAAAAGGGTMATGDDDFAPFGRPKNGGGRNVGTYSADVWGNEMLGASPYDGAKSFRTQQLARIEAKLDALTAKLDALAAGTPAGGGATSVTTAAIAEAVSAELAKRLES